MDEIYAGELSPDQIFEMLQVHFPERRWPTKLKRTPELEDAYRNWLSSECDHDVEPVLRRKPIKSGGKPQLVRVCPDCGLQVQGPLSHSSVEDFESVPWLGELSRDAYDHRFDEFLWELVAICKTCHDRAHPEKEGRRTGDD